MQNSADDRQILDLRGLKCPLPSLLARRALLRAADGAELLVFADDPLAPVDVPHMCYQEGFEVVSVRKDEDGCEMVLRRPLPTLATLQCPI
jgi:tRNA 2-thiouridine synthesizing protein A